MDWLVEIDQFENGVAADQDFHIDFAEVVVDYHTDAKSLTDQTVVVGCLAVVVDHKDLVGVEKNTEIDQDNFLEGFDFLL